MKRYMLDTNMISHLIKNHPAVLKHVLNLPMSCICISAITEGELLFGLAKRPDIKHLATLVKELLQRIDVLPWSSGVITERYANVRADMQRQGKILAPLDLLIATHALAINRILVTNDKAFLLVPDLIVEDWTLE